MSDDRTGTLGSVNIRLPHFVDGEERYRRTYKPVTPASRIVTGADDAIAPETDIASWAITDWSGGEGDVRWRDRGRYNTGTGLHLAPDGSGLRRGYSTAEGAGQAGAIYSTGLSIYVARDMDDDLYLVSSGTTLSSVGALGGSAGRDATQIVRLNSMFYVLDDTGDIRQIDISGPSNSAWYTSGSFIDIKGSQGKLYGLDINGDLYDIDTSTASTRTKVVDTTNGFAGGTTYAAGASNIMAPTDVGVVYWGNTTDGTTYEIREYNTYTDTGAVLSTLPPGATVYDIGYYAGITFVTYSYDSSRYIWFLTSNAQPGSIGPLPTPNSASDVPFFIGLLGDRLHFVHDEYVWAYDLGQGALIALADLSGLTSTAFRQAGIWLSSLYLTADTYIVQTKTGVTDTSTNYTLSSGRDDYGYPGLPKLIHTVTVTTESAIDGNDTVEVGYSVDGGSTTWLSDDFATGESAHTWTVSTNASSVIGTEVEWHLRVSGADSDISAPKIVGLYSDASGARSRIEWAVAVDVDRSSTVEGEDVISALNGLKTTHAVVQWSDPFQVGPYDSAETFDVRVLDVSTPEYAEGEGLIALVKFQTVGVVGG